MISIIIAAAGESGRMKKSGSKITAGIAGAPVIIHSLEPLKKIKGIRQIIVAARAGEAKKIRALLNEFGWSAAEVINGGKCRSETIAKAIKKVSAESLIVAVHDAARPCASAELWKTVISAAEKSGAAVPLLPATDTIKSAGEGFVKTTVPRDGLYFAQTPQAFKANILRDSYHKSAKTLTSFTDDSSIVEAAGHRVAIVAGESSNIKITFDTDLIIAECLLLSNSSTL